MLTRTAHTSLALFLLVSVAAPLGALAEDDVPENVRIKVLTPAEAAAGLRVFRQEGDGPMDRAKMGALMNRALDNLKTPDGTIESASGTKATIALRSGEKLSVEYDAGSHSWSGAVFLVVLPQ